MWAHRPVAGDSPIVGHTLRECHLRDRTGALVLALCDTNGMFNTNPSPDVVLGPGDVLIAIGTPSELEALARVAGS